MSAAGKPRPLPDGDAMYTPSASTLRERIERRSATPAAYLHQLPRWALPTVLAGLLIAGLAVQAWPGAICLLLLAAFLGWLGYLSWPTLTPQGRLLRLAVPLALLAIAIGEFTT